MKKKNTKQSAMIWTPPSLNLPDIKKKQLFSRKNQFNSNKFTHKKISFLHITQKKKTIIILYITRHQNLINFTFSHFYSNTKQILCKFYLSVVTDFFGN